MTASKRYDVNTNFTPANRIVTGRTKSPAAAASQPSCGRICQHAVLRLKKAAPTALDGLSADSFSAAFTAKTDSVRSSTLPAPGPDFYDLAKDCRLRAFEPVDVPTVQRLVSSAANKNCELDPAPTWLAKMFASELSPFISVLFSASFRDGVFPSSQKCAVVTPVLKKPTLDASDMGNYRPISTHVFVQAA